jgi:glycerophosphoryl diester phosphodiesterase
MAQIDWLVSRPVAHRGLHDGKTVIENTPCAFAAAMASEYGIECDLQVSSDGEAMVYHDDDLGRLTEGTARLDAMTAAELKHVRYKASPDRIMTLGELCDLVRGRSTLLIELKSQYDADRRLVRRAAAVLSGYGGPVAVMSFDPAQMSAFGQAAPALVRGLVAERRPRRSSATCSSAAAWMIAKRAFAYGAQVLRMQPQFIAYSVTDLPSTMTSFAGNILRLPILAWTVRTAMERQTALRHADQIIFEGFRP